MLFLTENYAALNILKHYIRGAKQETVDVIPEEDENGSEGSHALEPFILFGSSFPRDKEYTQVDVLDTHGCCYVTVITWSVH